MSEDSESRVQTVTPARSRAHHGEATLVADDPLAGEPMWELAQRVVQSRGFMRSRLLTRFLLFICERHLLGQYEELTEQRLGEQVFGRPPGYRPGEDNIVRNYARLLRQRLEEYFNAEGADEPYQIIVPRGRYHPVLLGAAAQADADPAATAEANETAEAAPNQGAEELTQPLTETEEPAVEAIAKARASRTVPVRYSVLVPALILCVGLAAWLVWSHRLARRQDAGTVWSSLLANGRDSMIVAGDDGVVLFQDLTHRRVTLQEYATGDFRSKAHDGGSGAQAVANELGMRRYTSFVDLQIISEISQLPEARAAHLKVRYAREVSIDDLKQANLILLGSLHSNPWTELYQNGLNFRFQPQSGSGDLTIYNLHPRAGEARFYNTAQDDARTTYGLLALIPNFDGESRVLLLEGLNMAGTQAAAEVLLEDKLPPSVKKILTSGDVSARFEILVKTSNFGANATRPEIVGVRIGNDV